ncbi:MAG: hypothetical protein HQM08_28175 [Candidatus Riflebacteria bacterium]|nr:hypothetical protein [Candidatus Riflebacteria bacterium]
MSSNPQGERSKKAIEFVCLLGLFSIPLFFFHVRLESWKSEEDASTQNKIEKTLERTLSNIETNCEPIQYFERILIGMEKRCFSGGNILLKFQTYAKFLKRRFPGLFEFTFIDSHGNVVPSACDTNPPKILLKRFFINYQEFLDHKVDSLNPSRQFIRVFFGKLVSISQEIHEKVQNSHQPDDITILACKIKDFEVEKTE